MTNYEFEDYREQPPYDDPGPWLGWGVPEKFIFRYVFRLIFWIVLIPFILFGVMLSPLGMLIQLLAIDYICYMQYKLTNML